jgi:hypothetical protein
MQLIDSPNIKYSFTTRAIPLEEMARVTPMYAPPRIGDLVLAEVLELGRNTRIEIRSGVMMSMFPGDHIVCAFGNRYATDQYEGYVPTRSVEGCDLLSAGGACGEVVSKHTSMVDPTRLGIVGLVSDKHELPINQRAFGLPPHAVGESLETGFDLARLPRAASGELLFAWRDDRGQGERRSPKNPCPNTPAR